MKGVKRAAQIKGERGQETPQTRESHRDRRGQAPRV